MNTPCPHCQAEIEIDPATLAALAGKSHFACPACQGAVAVPTRPQIPASTHRGLNRNLLILGGVALLVLGGLGFFLASQKSGDTNITNQNIRNEIINNSYFTQLIADGVTTKADLEAIADIRPYGDDFIGISKETLTWERAQDYAKRTGASVLAVDDVSAESRSELVKWLGQEFESHLTSSVWVKEQGAPAVLSGSEILAIKNAEGTRKALFRWSTLNHRDPAATTPERSFVNSIGMKFVPVPGTKVLFCIHETRRKDFQAFAAQNPNIGGNWKNPTLIDKPLVGEPFDEHPVASLTRDDAEKFCQWLSAQTNQRYRLPTEEEWNKAAGYHEQVMPGENPDDLTKKATSASAPKIYPWGSQWPPTKHDGNYGINSDPFPTTAPVMSFRPNQYGIYDLGGNLWEWVSDQYWNKDKDFGPLRGGAWDVESEGAMRSGCRFGQARYVGSHIFGFRVVLDLGESEAPSVGVTPDNPLRRKLVESVLSKGGIVKIRKENGIVDVTRMEDLPAGSFHLDHVDQVNGDFDDADAVLLAHFPELSSMRLHRCSVTRLPLEELLELQNLELVSCRVPDVNLRPLAGRSSLHRMDLSRGRISRSVVGIIAECPNLESVSLADIGLLDGDLGPLTRLPHLKNLLLESNLSDDGLADLARIPSLDYLELIKLNPRTVTLAPLQKLQVRQLKLFLCSVTPAMLENVALMPGLRSIIIEGGEISDKTLKPLYVMKQLETINLRLQVSDEQVEELRKALPDVRITR